MKFLELKDLDRNTQVLVNVTHITQIKQLRDGTVAISVGSDLIKTNLEWNDVLKELFPVAREKRK